MCHKNHMSVYIVVFYILFARVSGRRELFFIAVSCCTNVLFLPAPGSIGFLWPVFLSYMLYYTSVRGTLQNVFPMMCLYWF